MQVRTSQELYFQQAVRILRSFPPFNKLANGELTILGELMLRNYVNPGKLLSKTHRDDIVRKLDISADVFRNCLSKLRKLGILKEDELNPKFVLEYKQALHFEFYDEEEK